MKNNSLLIKPMKRYWELNLKAIRESNNLDFAHYTYAKGQCSCCYGPENLPSLYWKNRTILHGDDFTFILFKNADNGSGAVTKNDAIEFGTCISYHVKDMEQLQRVCLDLQRQLGPLYHVVTPKDFGTCIILQKSADMLDEKEA